MDDRRVMNQKKLTVLICWFSVVAIYTGRLNLSIVSPLMQKQGIISTEGIGLLGSMFFYTYAVGQLFSGYFGDRFSPRLMAVTGLLFAGIGNLSAAIKPSFPVLLIMWAIVNGIAQSMIWGPVLRVVSELFHGEKQTKAAIVLSLSPAVGSITATALALCMSFFGVRTVFFVPGTILVCISILTFIFLPHHKSVQQKPKHENPFKLLFFDREVRSMIFPAGIHGVIKDNINLWIPLYFVKSFDADIKKAALSIFLVPLISLGGRLLFPKIYNLCGQNEKRVIAFSFLLCGVTFLPLIFCNPNLFVTVILVCLAAASINLINTSILSIYPLRFKERGAVSSVSGMMDFITYLFAGVSSCLFGFLISTFGFSCLFGVWVVLSFASALMLYKNKFNVL
jgi:Sugar phosphate permease